MRKLLLLVATRLVGEAVVGAEGLRQGLHEQCPYTQLAQKPSQHLVCSAPNLDTGFQLGDSLWTDEPYCIETAEWGTYCAYSNGHFGQNLGIGIVTTPGIVNSSRSMFQTALYPTDKHYLPDIKDTWELRDIPGKGKGVVATRFIARGETIMTDHIAILADFAFANIMRWQEGEELLQVAVSRLAHSQDIRSLSRMAKAGPPTVADIMSTNGFGETLEGRQYMQLFPRIAVSPTRIELF